MVVPMMWKTLDNYVPVWYSDFMVIRNGHVAMSRHPLPLQGGNIVLTHTQCTTCQVPPPILVQHASMSNVTMALPVPSLLVGGFNWQTSVTCVVRIDQMYTWSKPVGQWDGWRSPAKPNGSPSFDLPLHRTTFAPLDLPLLHPLSPPPGRWERWNDQSSTPPLRIT